MLRLQPLRLLLLACGLQQAHGARHSVLVRAPARALPVLKLVDVSMLPTAEEAVGNERERLQPQLPPPSRGLFALAMVPVAWGTYGPAIKTLYSLDAPPPELLFSLMNYVVSAAALVLVSPFLKSPPTDSSELELKPALGIDEREDPAEPPSSQTADRRVTFAALELSAYLFVGSTVQLFGIQQTTAARAAFIVQLTTVIVPLLEAAIARTRPSAQTLGLCALAFSGVALMVTTGADSEQLSSTLVGDALIGISAIAYSLHVVRLGYHAPRLPTIELARAKEISRLLYASGAFAVGLFFSSEQGRALEAFISSFTQAPDQAMTALAIVCWSGVVTTAFATWGQSYGQSAVSPGTASVVYASQPIWSAIFGFFLLGETLEPQASVGAVLVLLAVGAAGLASTQQTVAESDSVQ